MWAALTLLTEVKGMGVVTQVVHIAGNIRTAQRAAIEHNVESLRHRAGQRVRAAAPSCPAQRGAGSRLTTFVRPLGSRSDHPPRRVQDGAGLAERVKAVEAQIRAIDS